MLQNIVFLIFTSSLAAFAFYMCITSTYQGWIGALTVFSFLSGTLAITLWKRFD